MKKLHHIACESFAYRVKASPSYTKCGLDLSDDYLTYDINKVTCKKCIKRMIREEYVFSTEECNIPVTKVTKYDHNLLDIKTNKCIFKKHLCIARKMEEMTEQEYNKAFDRITELNQELKVIKTQILEYENNNLRPTFKTIDEVREFITEAQEGALLEYEGNIYIVGDYEELVNEYGWEEVHEAIQSATLEDLVDGSLSILELVK